MENATKGLLIAGAVLIAIVLISIGVVILNNSKKTTDTSDNVSTTIQTKSEAGITAINSININ